MVDERKGGWSGQHDDPTQHDLPSTGLPSAKAFEEAGTLEALVEDEVFYPDNLRMTFAAAKPLERTYIRQVFERAREARSSFLGAIDEV